MIGNHSGSVTQVPSAISDSQRIYVGNEWTVFEFIGEIAFEYRARWRAAAAGHVLLEDVDDPYWIASLILQANGKIKQIPAFLALIERT